MAMGCRLNHQTNSPPKPLTERPCRAPYCSVTPGFAIHGLANSPTPLTRLSLYWQIPESALKMERPKAGRKPKADASKSGAKKSGSGK
jgi:hypothetical protein